MLWTAFYMHTTVFLESALRISGGQHQLLYPEDKRVPKLFPHVEILNRIAGFSANQALATFCPTGSVKKCKNCQNVCAHTRKDVYGV